MDTTTDHNIPPDQQDYYLRTPDQQEYGPANLETIRQWCREGRITPDQQISADREQWQDVTTIPALEFDWLLVLEDGTEAGPFHRAILEEEWDAGNIPKEARFKHRHSEAIFAPEDLPPMPPPAAADTAESAEQPLTSTGRPVERCTEPVPSPASIATTEPAEQQKEEEESPSLRMEILARHAAEAREQLALARDNLHTLRTRNTLLEDENLHLQERVTTADAERNAAEENLLDLQNQAAQNATELDNLRAQLEQMQEHYESLQLENQRQFEQIDDLRAKALTTEQSWKREFAVLESQLEGKNRIIAEVTNLLQQDIPARSPVSEAPATAPPAPNPDPPTTRAHPNPVPQAQQPKTRPVALTTPGRALAPWPRWIGFPGPWLALLLVLLIAAGIFTMMISAWSARRHPTIISPAETLPAATTTSLVTTAPAVAEETLVLQPEPAHQPPATNATAVPPRNWPSVDLPGLVVVREENAMRITFEDGLFVSGTRLQEKARQDLLQLARLLQPHIADFTLIAEGHTDAIPIRPGNEQFIDNYSLALARAETVKHFLADQGGLPSTRIHTASAGPSAPPYPNDTATNRARNRTVVLSLIPTP